MKPKNLNSDPVRFAKSVFNVELWSEQEHILRAIKRERRVAIKAAHSTGKTFVSAIAAIWFAARYEKSRVITLAPGWLTTRAVIWSEIHSLLARARLRLPATTLNQTEIRLGPDNLIIGLSTNDSSRLQGHHAEHLLIIADEAPGIDPSFWPAVEGILASGDSHLLLLGNPTVSSGYFYDAFTRNREAWTTFSISAFDTPNLAGIAAPALPGGLIAPRGGAAVDTPLAALLAAPDASLDDNPCPYLVTKRWVRERYDEWFNGSPENSPLWQSRVLGEFPSSSSNALIPLAWLEAARRPAVDPGGELICGIDPAGSGPDRTAAIVCAGGAIIDYRTWTDPEPQGPVLAWLRRWQSRIRLVRYDSCGVGCFFADPLRKAGYLCEPINVASASKDRELYANLKAERFWGLRERFKAGEVSGLTDEMLAELAAITWLEDAHGRICIEGKSDVKAVLGHSPDLAESLMIAIGELPPEPMEYRGIARGARSLPAAAGLAALGYRESPEEAMRNFTEDQAATVGACRRSEWDAFQAPMAGWTRVRGY